MKKLTEEEIKTLKNDPLIKMLTLFGNLDLDKIIKDTEKESDEKSSDLEYKSGKNTKKFSHDVIDNIAYQLIMLESAFNTCKTQGVDLKVFSDGLVYDIVNSVIVELMSSFMNYDDAYAIVQLDRNLTNQELSSKINSILNG